VLRIVSVTAAIVAVGAGPSACGGDDSPSRTVTVEAGKPVEVTGKEHSFDPDKIVVDADGYSPAQVSIKLRNAGSLAHDLRVQSEDGDDLGGTPVFQGGKTEGATLSLKPGTYRIICSVGDHEQLGMKGTLEVSESLD